MQEAIGRLVEALQCLKEAQKTLVEERMTWATYQASRYAQDAVNSTRYALKLLDKQEEENEEHDTKRGSRIRQDATKRNSTR